MLRAISPDLYICTVTDDLMPDAPELIAEFIDGESDVSAKRNAFVMLCNSDQERAVQYQLSVIDSISTMGDIIQAQILINPLYSDFIQ